MTRRKYKGWHSQRRPVYSALRTAAFRGVLIPALMFAEWAVAYSVIWVVQRWPA